MTSFLPQFDERLTEINSYLEFLEGIQVAAQSGPPTLSGSGFVVTTEHQKILYSGVFLQLYNLVESTVVGCLEAVTDATITSGTWKPGDLNEKLKKEWVRVVARSHEDLTYENRLKNALQLCDHLVESLPVKAFNIEVGGGGNWDDVSIEEITRRLGFQLQVSNPVYQGIKRKIHNEYGPLGLVKSRRNSLAHGGISFAQCGADFTVSDLRDIAKKTFDYLREVVSAFSSFVRNYEYLISTSRPSVEQP